MSDDRVAVKVWQNCTAMHSYPLMTLGLVVLIMDIILPLIIYGIKRATNPERDYKTKEPIGMPTISRSWRDPDTFPLLIGSLEIVIIVYITCLEEAWLIGCIVALCVWLFAIYIVNPETKSKKPGVSETNNSKVHGLLAVSLFTILVALSWLITVYYYDWGVVGLVFTILSTTMWILLVVFAVMTRMNPVDFGKGYYDTTWSVFEVGLCVFFLLLVALVPLSQVVNTV